MRFTNNQWTHIFIISLFFNITSCCSQSLDSKSVFGDWYPGYLRDIEEKYTEFYIDETYIYYLDPISESIISNSYYIQNSKLYLNRPDKNDFEIMGLISVENDTLFIKNDFGKSFFLKQKVIPNLGIVINNIGKFDDFFEGFSNRAANWNEKKFE